MNAVIDKPTLEDLRGEARRLGIDEEFTGGALDELLSVARDHDDPLGYLAIHAPAGPPAKIGEASDESDGIDDDPMTFCDVCREEAAAARANFGALALDAGPTEESSEHEPIGDVPAPLPIADTTAALYVPLAAAKLENCYIGTHVEARLSHDQALTLRRVHLALDARGARLANGRRVIHVADAVKWLLEQIAADSGL